MSFETGTLHIKNSLDYEEGELRLRPVKTKKSERMVKLPQTVLEELKRHLRQQLELKLKLGPAYSDGGFVCGWEDGRPFNPDWLNRAFRRLLAHFGLPPIRFHDLRHTHATLLLREGVPVKVIAERLGHSTTSFTQDIYSHVLPEMQDRAAVFDQLMKKEK